MNVVVKTSPFSDFMTSVIYKTPLEISTNHSPSQNSLTCAAGLATPPPPSCSCRKLMELMSALHPVAELCHFI